MNDVITDTAIMIIVSGHPDHIISKFFFYYDLKIIGSKHYVLSWTSESLPLGLPCLLWV